MVTLTISAQPLTWGITLEGVSSGGSACDLASRGTRGHPRMGDYEGAGYAAD